MWQHFEVAGTGLYLPSRTVSADEIDARTGRPTGWTRDHVGVLTRHECVPPETLGGMAVAAMTQALADASVGWADIDLLIDASTCPHQPIPCNAAYLLHLVGAAAEGVAGMDVHGTCLGFPLAVNVANALLGTGAYRRVLVVCSETALRRVNWDDPESAGLMGDGAAAVVLRRADPSPGYAFAHQTFPQYLGACQIRGGGLLLPPDELTPENAAEYRFAMDGPRLVMAALKHLPPLVDKLLTTADTDRDGLQVVPHQASPRALEIVRRRLKFAPDRFHDRVAHLGNLVSASIPSVLHMCRTDGTLRAGEGVMLLGTSAGYAQAGLVFRL